MALSLFHRTHTHTQTHSHFYCYFWHCVKIILENSCGFLCWCIWVCASACVCVWGVAPWISAFEEPKQSRSITERPPHGNYSANNEAQLRQLCILGLIQWGLLQRASTGLRLIERSKLGHRLRGSRTSVDIGNNGSVSWLPTQLLNLQLVDIVIMPETMASFHGFCLYTVHHKALKMHSKITYYITIILLNSFSCICISNFPHSNIIMRIIRHLSSSLNNWSCLRAQISSLLVYSY